MRKNIFIKSMLRQPVRTLLLVILIATTSFAFTLRAVEFVVMRQQISQMTKFFQSVGVLSHREGTAADISAAIEIVANSPYVSFYDRRRGFEGTLVDMHNAYMSGSFYWIANYYYNNFRDEYSAIEYINLLPRLRHRPGFAGFSSGDSFFYGELLYVEEVLPIWFGETHHMLLHIKVDYLLQGYPERVAAGSTIRLRMDLPDGNGSPFDDIEIGQRYFFRGAFYWGLGGLPQERANLVMYIRPIGYQGLWYVPVSPGESVDTVALGMCNQLKFARHVQSAVRLRTTRDMAYLPFTQTSQGIVTMHEGRHINMDDYVNARPVIVVSRYFAETREVSIGDTLRININAEQHLVYSPYYIMAMVAAYPYGAVLRPLLPFPELGVLSKPGAYPYITLEVEIVGIFEMFRFRPIQTSWSSASTYMFIPDSLIPSQWGLQSAYFGDVAEDYTPDLWFNFALDDPRNMDTFLWDVRDDLADMGLRATFVGPDGSGFLSTADVILMSVSVNLIIFSAVMILVLVSVVALYMWQRSRDYAILRALGGTVKNIYARSVCALMFFGVPAVIAGCVMGWLFAIRIAETTFEGFGEIIAAEAGTNLLTHERAALIAHYTEMAALPIINLVLLVVAVLVAMLTLITICNLHIARKSVLYILNRAKL